MDSAYRRDFLCHINVIKERTNIILDIIEKTQYHPFLVVLVTNENGEGKDIKISGFNMTSSTLKFLERPNRFIKLDKNPNPETDAESYVSIDYIENQPAKLFTRPIRRWELSKEDEIKIDKLLLAKKK